MQINQNESFWQYLINFAKNSLMELGSKKSLENLEDISSEICQEFVNRETIKTQENVYEFLLTTKISDLQKMIFEYILQNVEY